MTKINNSNLIYFKEAKVIATKAASLEMKNFIVDESKILDEYYLEAEHCWIFFKHPTIVIPKHVLCFRTFAVSDRGGCRLVYDLRDEPEKMQKHLSDLSNYFKEKGE